MSSAAAVRGPVKAVRNPFRRKEWGPILLLAASVLLLFGTVIPKLMEIPSLFERSDSLRVYDLPYFGIPVFIAMIVVAVIYSCMPGPSKELAVSGFILGGIGLIIQICGSLIHIYYSYLYIDVFGDQRGKSMDILFVVITSIYNIVVILLPAIAFLLFFIVSYRQRNKKAHGGI